MAKRFPYLIGTFIIIILLGISLYLQLYEGFVPCPLCSLQRITFILLGLIFFAGIWVGAKRKMQIFIPFLASLFAALGVLFSGRQVWLQHFPPPNTECGVSLQYMLQVLPMHQVVQKIFEGTAECTQLGWSFLSLSMAEWSLCWFLIFLLGSLYLLIRKK